MGTLTSDFFIIGGGIIGISLARMIKRRFPDCSVLLIEKEQTCGEHASGRNSGVLHAGFYYSADSLKARFTVEGNKELVRYCEQKNIPVNKCGKLVVAKSENEHEMLDELLRRGLANGVELHSITAVEAEEIEPRVRTCERAIYSPDTSTVNPKDVIHSMVSDADTEGIEIRQGIRYLGHKDNTLITSAGKGEAGYIVNAAGLYADHVARGFGFSEKYRILPFKGLYLYSDEPPGAFRTNIYPVPDLRNPFLGVHLTVTVDQRAKIGPTAIPAFWREQYFGTDNFRFSEFSDILRRQLGLIVSSDSDFKKLAFSELRKYSRKHMVNLAGSLAKAISTADYNHWGTPGIRAQLFDTKSRKLEMDFVVEGDDRSFHVLNAVSPAFTCALPFSRYVCDLIARKLQ